MYKSAEKNVHGRLFNSNAMSEKKVKIVPLLKFDKLSFASTFAERALSYIFHASVQLDSILRLLKECFVVDIFNKRCQLVRCKTKKVNSS